MRYSAFYTKYVKGSRYCLMPILNYFQIRLVLINIILLLILVVLLLTVKAMMI